MVGWCKGRDPAHLSRKAHGFPLQFPPDVFLQRQPPCDSFTQCLQDLLNAERGGEVTIPLLTGFMCQCEKRSVFFAVGPALERVVERVDSNLPSSNQIVTVYSVWIWILGLI